MPRPSPIENGSRAQKIVDSRGAQLVTFLSIQWQGGWQSALVVSVVYTSFVTSCSKQQAQDDLYMLTRSVCFLMFRFLAVFLKRTLWVRLLR